MRECLASGKARNCDHSSRPPEKPRVEEGNATITAAAPGTWQSVNA